jgi:hypothetical protein
MTRSTPTIKPGQLFTRSKPQTQHSELLKIGYPSLQQQQLSVTFGALTASPPQSPIMSSIAENNSNSSPGSNNIKTPSPTKSIKETPASQAFPSYCTVCDTLIDPTTYSPLYCSHSCREKDSNSTGKFMPANSLLLKNRRSDVVVDDDHDDIDEFDFINPHPKISPFSSARESLASLEISSRESMSSFASSKRFGPGGAFRPPSDAFYSPILSPHQLQQQNDLELIPDIPFLSTSYGPGDLMRTSYPGGGATRHSNPVIGSDKTAALHRKYSFPAVVSASSSSSSVVSTDSATLSTTNVTKSSLSSSPSSNETATESSTGGLRPRRQSFYIRSGKHLYSSGHGTPTKAPATPQLTGPSQFAKQLGLSGDAGVPCNRLSTNGAYFFPDSPRSITLVLPQQPPTPVVHDFEYEFPRVQTSKNGTLPTSSPIGSR